MDKPIQKRKGHARSKKRMGARAAVSQRNRCGLHDQPGETGVRQTSLYGEILEISHAVQTHTRKAVNRITKLTRKSKAGNDRNTRKTRPVNHRTKMIHLLIDILRKSDIPTRRVLGAQLQGGYWWIHFDFGWIKASQMLKHKVIFKNQHLTKTGN